MAFKGQPQSRLAVIQLIWRHRAHIVAFYDAVPIFNKNDGACDGVTSATMEVMDTIQQLLTRWSMKGVVGVKS